MTSRIRAFAASLLLLPALLLGACSSSSSTPAPTLTGLSVSPTTASLTVGATRQLTATGTYSDGSTANLTTSASFLSDTTTVATVSTTGLVTAVAVGTAKVTASVSGKSAFCSVTVSAAAPTLSSIAITPNPATVAAGSTLQLVVTGTYSDTSTQDLTATSTFLSSATGVATVTSPGGLVTGVSAGTATITANAGGKSATRDVSVTGTVPPPDANQVVFWDSYGTGVVFRDFGGAINNVTIDATETFNGRHVINFQVTSAAGYSGGAWFTGTPRDLSAYNALTFYAKASVVQTLNVTGFGNDGGAASGTPFPTERAALPLTTSWQKFTIPIPNPARFLNVGGLFHVADANKGYTLFLADVIYEHLGSGVLGTGAASINVSNSALSLPVAATSTVPEGQSQVLYAVTGDPTDPVKLSPVSNGFFDFASANSAVASVSAAGVITGVAPGGPVNITATLGGAAVSGAIAVTVTGAAAAPTTVATAPTALPADAISLFSSTYAGTAADKSANVETWFTSWSGAGGSLTDPYTIAGTGHDVKRYLLQNYAGIEFIGGNNTAGNNLLGSKEIDLTTPGMTNFHMDVWSPEGKHLVIKLIDAGPDMVVGTADDSVKIIPVSLAGQSQWIPVDLLLSDFAVQLAAWTGKNVGQIVIALDDPAAGGTLYVDNLYFHKAGGVGGSAPTTAPVAPTALPANAMSLFSSTYAGTAADFSARVDSYNATCFGPPGNTVADHVIATGSHSVKQYGLAANGFGIVELIGATGGTAVPPDSAICNGGLQSGASLTDVSGMTTVHFDVWSPGGSANFQVQLVNVEAGTLSGPGQGTGATPGTTYSSGGGALAAGTWVPYDIPMASLGPAGAPAGLTKLGLVKFFSVTGGTFFIDNIYFYKPPPAAPFADITFDAAGVTYSFGDFGGVVGSLVVDPVNVSNHVAKTVKAAGAQTWGGTSLGTGGAAFSAGKIPFSAAKTVMTVRFYSPAIGVPVLLKVEDSTNGGISAEKLANTTVANTWETLSFDLSTVNLSSTYDKVSVFPNFGTVPGADETYYIDDVTFVP